MRTFNYNARAAGIFNSVIKGCLNRPIFSAWINSNFAKNEKNAAKRWHQLQMLILFLFLLFVFIIA